MHMGRAGRGGGGFRGGGGRMGGGGSRGGSGRIGGLGGLGGGSSGRAGRGTIPTSSGGRSGGFTPPPARRTPVRTPVAPRRNPGFGAGVGVGMGMGMMGGRRRRGWGWGGGWGWGRRRRMHHMGGMHMGMGPRHRGGAASGCASLFIALAFVILVIAMISMLNNWTSPQYWVYDGSWRGPAHVQHQPVDPFPGVIPSTRVRTPLPDGSAAEAGSLFTDHLGWIGNQTALMTGMRNFHQATGVRPHLYLIGDVDGNTWPGHAELYEFAQNLYDDLFGDEAHLLVVYLYNYELEDFSVMLIPGTQARSVIDQEAQDILMDFLARYYFYDISEEEYFSRTFNSTGQRIMYVPEAPPEPPDNRPIWITIIVVTGVVLLILILFKWWKRKQEQKNLEAEQTERILSQPLETIGDSHDAASQLAQQYDDDNNN